MGATTSSTVYHTTCASTDMSADSPRRTIRGVPAVVPPQLVNDRSIIDSVAGFINDVTLTNQSQTDPKDTITWARFETTADISDPTFGDDFEVDSNVTPPLLLILGYGLGIQVWAIPVSGEAIEVLSWRHGNVTALRILPTPFSADANIVNEPIDNFVDKRPLMAICDSTTTQSGLLGQQQQPPHCSVNFISLKSGQQIKTIKFKNNVLDILANRSSVIIIFPERIAIFDARTLEDRLSVTSCYPSPGINPNPVVLGSRWLAYSESKLLHTKRSGGGCHGDGVSSYTATVLNAAKSFGKGLRELGEQMAAGLTGTASSSSGISSKSASIDPITGDIKQPGVVTILDIKYPIKSVSPTTGTAVNANGSDPIIAHFIAHSDAIVAMEFDCSGMLLLTADKRGHDFHLFRIHPHPVGPHLASVHHLYILHRGDTSAKVQNISFSMDSRWVAVSTLRGTTHVFPITPYGGSYGVRTHASLHVVNKLSRFHRSAGLSADNRSSSPISHSDSMSFNNQFCLPYNNPTMPPFPRPHVILPLAQLRQPTVLGSPPGSAHNLSYQKSSISSSAAASAAAGRQRLSSLSDDNGKPLSVCAIFAKARSWLLFPPNNRDGPAHKTQRKAVDSLFIMAGHGALIQYDLDTKLASNVARDKICDDTAIELEVEAKAQWNLRRNDSSIEIQPPLSADNLLVRDHYNNDHKNHYASEENEERNDRWLSQVEIITHAGPHRRLWMGPQFVFKTYNTPSGSNLSHIDTEAVEIGVTTGASTTSGSNIIKPGRSSPMNMPLTNTGRSAVPVLIESGSYSSIEQSPKLMDRFKHDHLDSDYTMTHGESRLKEDLADAMRESPSSIQHKDTGDIKPTTFCLLNKSRQYTTKTTTTSPPQLYKSSMMSGGGTKFEYHSSTISPLVYNDNNTEQYLSAYSDSEPSPPPQIQEYHDSSSSSTERSITLIEKVVNPLGIVTTITRSPSENDFELNNPYGADYDPDDYIIHENCDEALFRPVVTIFCNDPQFDDEGRIYDASQVNTATVKVNEEPPELISTQLIVPVVEKQNTNNKKLDQKYENLSKNDNEKTNTIEMINTDCINMNKSDEQQSMTNKKSKNLNKKLNKYEQTKGTSEISSLENFSYSVKTNEVKIADNKNSEIDDIPKRGKPTKSGSRKIENIDVIKPVNKTEPKNSSTSVKNEEKSIKIERENVENLSTYVKEIKTDVKDKDLKLSGKLNRKSEERELITNKNEKKSLEKSKIDNSTAIQPIITVNIKESDIGEHHKPNKDEDSESFESLENIEMNIDFASGKSPIKSVGSSTDEFEIIDNKISPLKKDIIDEKYEQKTDSVKSTSYSEKINLNKKELESNPPKSINSETVEIKLTKKNKTGKQNNNVMTEPVIEEHSDSIELEFYDKFARDENTDVVMKTSIKKDSTKVEIDYPSLGETRYNKSAKKSKYENSNKSPSQVTASLPATSNKTESVEEQQITKNEKNNKKSDDNIPVPENIEPTVTFTLPMKKKSNKRSPIKEFIPPVVTDDSARNITAKPATETRNISKPNKKNSNTKELLQKLDFETIQSSSSAVDGNIDVDEFSLPPLSPLQPFETKFEKTFELLRDGRNTEEHFSLINFESPVQDETKNSKTVDEISEKFPKQSVNKNVKTNDDNNYNNMPHKTKGLPENNIIFALCGSLHYENENAKSISSTNDSETHESITSLKNIVSEYDEEQQPEQYKNLEQVKSRSMKLNHEQRPSRDGKLKIQPNSSATTPSTPSTSSSSDTEESSATISFKLIKNHHEKNNKEDDKLINLAQINDDDVYDEELRPLISACSLISSVSGATTTSITNTIANKKSSTKIKNKNYTDDELSPTSQIVSEIANAIIDTNTITTTTPNLPLPRQMNIKNQTKTTKPQSSDLSIIDQTNNTIEEQGIDSDEQQQPIILTKPDNKSFDNITAIVGTPVTDQMHDETTGQTEIIASGSGTALNSGGNNTNIQQQQQNTKKKSKRKKR